MRARRPPAVLTLLVGVIVLGSCSEDVGDRDTASVEAGVGATTSRPSSARPADDRVRVTCGAQGPDLGAAVVAARPTGVVLTVVSTAGPGMYLTYTSSGGPAGGELLAGQATTLTLQAPPGDLVLGCTAPPDMDRSRSATLRVTDPHDYWRPGSPTDVGCRRGGSQPSWIAGLEATGRTPRQAVAGVLANVTRLLPAAYAARPADVGYVEAPTQVWIATKDGRSHMTVEVSRRGSTYAAGPGSLCGTSAP